MQPVVKLLMVGQVDEVVGIGLEFIAHGFFQEFQFLALCRFPGLFSEVELLEVKSCKNQGGCGKKQGKCRQSESGKGVWFSWYHYLFATFVTLKSVYAGGYQSFKYTFSNLWRQHPLWRLTDGFAG